MTVIYNTNFTHNHNSYLTLVIEHAARQAFGARNVVLADNRSLASIASRGEHDVLICIDGQRLHEGLLRRIRPSFQTIIMWLFEDPFMLEYNLQNISLFDYVFTNDPACVDAYGGKGHYLPLAASERFHSRDVKRDSDLEYDIFFAGTMWPNRVRSLRRVKTAFPNARLKLVCPTNEYLPPLPAELARIAIQSPVNHESFVDFANASRVTITMFRDYASHGEIGQATAPGPRLYELGLGGTAQVVRCGDPVDSAHFRDMDGVDVVRDDAALVSAIGRLLNSPELRAARAMKARDQVAARHLYTHRMNRMSDITRANFTIRPGPATSVAAGRRLRVLMCTHSTIHRSTWGGVEVYQRGLAIMLGRDIEAFLWLRLDGQCQLIDSQGTVLERFDMPDVGWLDCLTNAPEEAAFSSIISQYGFDLVHFQHLGHHAASLPIIAKASGVGTVFSAHDFFLVCSRYNLLNHDQLFCDIGNKSVSACDICLRISEGLPAGAQGTRRAFMVEVIRSIDVFLFGSLQSESLTTRIYPELAKRRRVVIGVPMPKGTAFETPPIRSEKEGAPLVIAVVGNFLRAKGADAVISLIEEANPELFQFHIIGNAEGHYADVLNRWNKPNVVYHGRYAPGELGVIADADVSLHLSIWPETYCISLSETWQRRLIPIVSDVGALGERVTHGVNGFKVAIGDVSAVLDHLELLRASPATRRAIVANIGAHLWTDHGDYAASLIEIYRSVSPRRPLGDAGLGLDAGQIHLLPHPSWKIPAPPRHILDPSRRSNIRLELPPAIQDWSYIQGSEVHVDTICGVRPEFLRETSFNPAPELHVRGWTFVPGVNVAGQIVIALVGEGGGPVIFFPASRDSRDDIVAIFPRAPVRSGFEGRVALRGKWCEGHYGVAIVNGFGDRASFCLTGLVVEIKDSHVVGVLLDPPSNAKALTTFYRVSRQTGEEDDIALTRLPFDRDAWATDRAMAYCIDLLEACGGEDAKAADGAARAFNIRGWGFVHRSGLAGLLYIGLVDLESGARTFYPAVRRVRGDVGRYHFDAPLCCGFEEQLALPRSWGAGQFACVLVNTVNGAASYQFTGLSLTLRDGGISEVVKRDLNQIEVKVMEYHLREAHIERPIVQGDAAEIRISEVPAIEPRSEDRETARQVVRHKALRTSRKAPRAATR